MNRKKNFSAQKKLIILLIGFGFVGNESIASYINNEIPDEFGQTPGAFFRFNIPREISFDKITPQDLQNKICDLSYRDISCGEISRLRFANTPVEILILLGNNPDLEDELRLNKPIYPLPKKGPALIELCDINRDFIWTFVHHNCEVGKSNLKKVVFPENLIPLDLQNTLIKDYPHIHWKF